MDEEMSAKLKENITRMVALIKVFYDAAIAVGFDEDNALALAMGMVDKFMGQFQKDGGSA